jgi:hypothetical protein
MSAQKEFTNAHPISLPPLNLIPVKQIGSSKHLGHGRWLELSEIDYIVPHTNERRSWEVCKRKKTTKPDPDAVDGN